MALRYASLLAVLLLSVNFTAKAQCSPDLDAPQIDCPADIELCATDASGAVVNFVISAFDFCDGAVAVVQTDPTGLSSGSVFPVGVHVLTFEAIDIATNLASCTFTVTIHPAPQPNFSVTDVCLGETSAFTDLSTIASGSIAQLEWDFGDGSTPVISGSTTHLYATDGAFGVTLIATSDQNCTASTVQGTTVHAIPTASFSAAEVCEGLSTNFNNLSTGVVSASWDFGDGNTSTDVSPQHTYLNDGTFNVALTITGTGGCTANFSDNVEVLPAPVADFTVGLICSGQSVTFTNTSDPGSYQWGFGNGQFSALPAPSATFNSAGDFDVSLSVQAANGCISTTTQTVTVSQTPDFTANVSNVLCFGGNTGSIVITPTVGTPDIFYSLNGGTPQLSQAFFNLSATNYNVTITDATGCSNTQVVTVGQPNTSVVAAITNVSNVTCAGGFDGSFAVAAGGGTAPFQYAIIPGNNQFSPVFTGRPAGTFDVRVTDSNGCIFETQATITEPELLILSEVSSSGVSCFGMADGTFTVSATGGTGTLLYAIEGNQNQASPTFSGLSGGNYNVIVTDELGCDDGINVLIEEPGLLLFSVLSVENLICNATPTGTIAVGSASGTAPYTYSINGATPQESGLFPNLYAGSYSLATTDANGCTSSLQVTVTEPTPVSIQTVSVPTTCAGQPTGMIQVTGSGGTPAYEFSINGGATFTPNTSIGGLLEGNYIVLALDANGCGATESVTVTGPPNPFELDVDVQDIACAGFTNGSITLNGSGGTAPYFYSFNNGPFDVVNEITDLNPGPVSYAAVDASGCLIANFVIISDPVNPIQIGNTLINGAACFGEASGSVAVLAFGGTGVFEYSSDNGQTYQNDNFMTGLAAGFYTVKVRDSNGCMASIEVEVTQPQPLSVQVAGQQNLNCDNGINGAVTLSADGGTPTYVYAINNGTFQTSNIFSLLAAGTYSLEVNDINGCSAFTTATIFAEGGVPVPSFSQLVSGTAVQFINTSTNGISYLWDFGDGNTSTDISPIHLYAEHGIYTVTLTVTNECGDVQFSQLVSTINIGIDDLAGVKLNVYPNPSNGIFNLEIDGAGTTTAISVSDLTGREVYSTQAQPMLNRLNINLSELAKGSYLITATTANGRGFVRIEVL